MRFVIGLVAVVLMMSSPAHANKKLRKSAFLTFDQFQAISMVDQFRYLKDLRSMVRDLEKNQNKKKKAKYAQRVFDDVSLFSVAHAATKPTQCVFAGNIVTGKEVDGRLQCYTMHFTKEEQKKFLCTTDKGEEGIKCSGALFGRTRGKYVPICVKKAQNSSKMCAKASSSNGGVAQVVTDVLNSKEDSAVRKEFEETALGIIEYCDSSPYQKSDCNMWTDQISDYKSRLCGSTGYRDDKSLHQYLANLCAGKLIDGNDPNKNQTIGAGKCGGNVRYVYKYPGDSTVKLMEPGVSKEVPLVNCSILRGDDTQKAKVSQRLAEFLANYSNTCHGSSQTEEQKGDN